MQASTDASPGLDLGICVSLDLETTGLNPEVDDIIEIGAVKFQGERVLGTFSTLINPQRSVPASIERLTGIRTADLQNAPTFALAAEGLRTFAGDYPIIGQNINFDLQFLSKKGLRLSGTPLDTFDLATIVLPSLPDYTLTTICAGLGIEHDPAHRAMSDAQMAMAVFVKTIGRMMAMPPAVRLETGRIASRAGDWTLKAVFQAMASTVGLLEEAGRLGLEGVDIDALADRLHVAPATSLKEKATAIDVDAVRGALSGDGALAARLGAFEVREEQLRMAEAVTKTFNHGGQLVAEAGTGTGKSLAYLLPAALYAAKSGKRVVVSTNTINLQEQVVGKDLPDALDALRAGGAITEADSPRYAILKGRANYLCLRRWAGMKNGDSLTRDEAKTLIKILCWLTYTSTGDRGELNLTPPEAAVWSRISASGYGMESEACSLSREGLCFFAAARQRAEAARVLCVNHALLTLNAKYGSLLPSYTHLIIDEAHNLEQVATDQFGADVDDDAFDEYLGSIAGGPGITGIGILPKWKLAIRPPLAEVRLRELHAEADKLEADVQSSRVHLSALFRLLDETLERMLRGGKESDSRIQLTPSVRSQPGWARVVSAWEDANISLQSVKRGLDHLANQVPGMDDQLGGQAEELQQEITAAKATGEELAHNLASALVQPDESMVHWLSPGFQRESSVQVHAAPLHVGPLLDSQLFANLETVVLTGATLSTEGNFEYLKERLSLKPTSELLVGSPFDYKRAALVYVPHDMPEPMAPDYQESLDKIIAHIARAAGGRTLVLYTSRSAMRNSRTNLKEPLAAEGITVLAQGLDGSPRQLTRALRTTPNVVLLGSGSFWEGVDIAGDALSVLVIARLPFTVPTDPVFAARSRKFDDAFGLYAIPQAVVRFRQGFGRLIRRKTDRGVMVVLDRRVFSKRYGAAFLDSLPPVTRQFGPAKDLPGAVGRWLAQRPLA